MLQRIVDSLVSLCSPTRGIERVAARATLQQIQTVLGGQGGYDAGKLSRLLTSKANLHENGVDPAQLDRITGQARDLWRNNPHARKIVRQIQVKTIGTQMRPQSQATFEDGRPHAAFRKRAGQIWDRFGCQSDFRGKPGRGGQHFTDQSKTGLGMTVRTGRILYRTRPLSRVEQRRRGLALPLTMQLVDGDRLDGSIQEHNGHQVLRGIEVDDDGQVVAYHILPYHPTDPRNRATGDSQRLTTSEIGHAFVTEDADQIDGVSWFAPALLQLRDTGDYQYNELKAAAMGACVVMGIRRATGQTGIGLNTPTGQSSIDADGNSITRLSPGTVYELGVDGHIEGFNPQRPNTNAESFVQHMLRVVASAMPGLKGSSLTNDYRRSSFASERSADNEIWPEIEGVQQWWGCSFQTPVYEDVITTAMLVGLFDDILPTTEFLARRDEYLAVHWQGPVSRSINPKDDATASGLEIAHGTSSPQIEAGKRGRNWLDILQQIADYVAEVQALHLPESVEQALLNQVLVGVQPAAAAETQPVGDDDDDARDRRLNRLSEVLAV